MNEKYYDLIKEFYEYVQNEYKESGKDRTKKYHEFNDKVRCEKLYDKMGCPDSTKAPVEWGAYMRVDDYHRRLYFIRKHLKPILEQLDKIKAKQMTIDEMKEKFIKGELEKGLFTADDKIVTITNQGFTISTLQDNGWHRSNIYEYIDNTWVESEEYSK